MHLLKTSPTEHCNTRLFRPIATKEGFEAALKRLNPFSLTTLSLCLAIRKYFIHFAQLQFNCLLRRQHASYISASASENLLEDQPAAMRINFVDTVLIQKGRILNAGGSPSAHG